ncbi:acetolactate synthase [Paucilactobacillus hokkaidonensis JCM 18461]|uniref:Acetolactate synthase n=2 Tax=Paucilactobacillus hokkaidonensis TaxID=1193095 RepID=A0A0A1GTR5_9LACO|nr:acetolactate synthase AlsS [Paucilactobacillus hokkaidonensis]KRO10094.1 acetolactate synthase [Paucilactobacillus hokkaidonensis]BAP85395.1 acetolactate synthase [Paucilactobacillus hokkaidonensis JCM 18461]
MADEQRYGADALVESLINHQVKYVFGIPGAKIDRLFELLDHPKDPNSPQLIVTRHEQNAGFLASGIGRLTGQPGVVATTSGPGASNLATPVVTATAEGDPIVAISGQVPLKDLFRQTHQSMANKELFAPITKFSAEIGDPENISEVVANAFQSATEGKQGASFISLPQDVDDAKVTTKALPPLSAPKLGPASGESLAELVRRIKTAKLPVLLVGMRASSPDVTAAIRKLVKKAGIPVVETFQGAGIISHELEQDYFFGRVGLFRNQPGDKLLKHADLVITVGYDAIEYEPRNWNAEQDAVITVIDTTAPQLDKNFQPTTELIGDIAATVSDLADQVENYQPADESKQYLQDLHTEIEADQHETIPAGKGNLNHPLAVIEALQQRVDDKMTVSVDVGSHYIWMARHFRSYEPRHLLFSNGMQTLGVALPWSISAALVRPNAKSVSVSGDAGFLFTGQELETAVRLGLNTVHLIWNDGYYDMVRFQEIMKYGKDAAVKFGPVDYVKYAQSFGATGLRVESPDQLGAVLDQAFATDGPVVVDIPIDYSHNAELGETMLADQF